MRGTVLIVALCACVTACGTWHDVQIWTQPAFPSDPIDYPADESTTALIGALEAGDCELAIHMSESLMNDLRVESSLLFHPDSPDDIDTAEVRAFLRRYVYASPPILEIGEHGFRFPRWMTDGYAFCLVEQGSLQKATTVYLAALSDGFDADLTWRLALVSYWDGNREIALSILQSWPTNVDVPVGHDAVLDRMRREADVPNSIQVRSCSID